MLRRAAPALAALALLFAACTSGPAGGGGAVQRSDAPGEEARGGAEELQEQQEATEQRLEALREARAAGDFGQRLRIAYLASSTWLGERVVDPKVDDWEPAVAADPGSSFVYLLTTRYGEPKPCPGNCPTPFITLSISSNNGVSWSDAEPLCACKGSGQFDPIIEVVPDTGAVYALWMNGFNVVFQKSVDHGQHWTDPVSTYGNVSWNDKPVLATSDDGQDVYVSWNGPTGGDPWVAQSHDAGASWTQTKVVDSHRYFFAFDAEVLSDGTAIFSESSFDYSGPAASAVGQVEHHAFISRDGGDHWENQTIGTVELGEPCETEGCYADFYAGHDTVTADDDDDLVFAFDGATTPLGPQRIFVRTSDNGGQTWTPAVAISSADRMATAPAAEATGNDDVRLWFAQRRPASRWNIWYRRSLDGGDTWSAAVRISDATSGAKYKNADGFLEFYGDYGETDVMSDGNTIAAWGEGFSWFGPGGVWFNVGI
jgi:hypothetical protein